MTDANATRLVCPKCGAVYRTDFESCALDGEKLTPFETDTLIGTTIADRYQIEACISEGAMGRVYRATHTRMSKRFAVKILFGEHAAQTRMRARFTREAEAASRLEHPNLVSVVDFGETPSRLLYLVMDFIEGPTCGEIVATEGAMAEQRALRLVREIARGLRHLHSREMIHRDLKLDNIIVTKDGQVETPKIVDLGVALLPLDGELQEKLTKQGTIVGTPAFMAPEQAFGDEVDPRSDVFGLGMVLYHLLAGRGPFDGSAVEVIHQNVTRPFPRISERNPEVDVSRATQRILDRMIEKHPTDRYESAQAVIDAIDRVRPPSITIDPAARATHASLTTDLLQPAFEHVRRRRHWLPWAIMALAGMLLIATGAIWLNGRGDSNLVEAESLAGLDAPDDGEVENEADDTEEIEEVEEDPGDGKPVVRKKRRRRGRRSVRRRSRAPTTHMVPLEKTSSPKARRAPSVAELSNMSIDVAELIRRVEDRYGPVSAGSLRMRHLAIRTPTNSDTPEELHRIARDLRALRREAKRALD